MFGLFSSLYVLLILLDVLLFAIFKFRTPVVFLILSLHDALPISLTVPITFKFCTPLMVVMFALAALIVPAFTVPVEVRRVVLIVFDTFKLLIVPTLVMLGWFAVLSVPLIVAAVILFATVMLVRPV